MIAHGPMPSASFLQYLLSVKGQILLPSTCRVNKVCSIVAFTICQSYHETFAVCSASNCAIAFGLYLALSASLCFRASSSSSFSSSSSAICCSYLQGSQDGHSQNALFPFPKIALLLNENVSLESSTAATHCWSVYRGLLDHRRGMQKLAGQWDNTETSVAVADRGTESCESYQLSASAHTG